MDAHFSLNLNKTPNKRSNDLTGACTNHFLEAFTWVKRDKSQNLLIEYAASNTTVCEGSMSPDICYAVVTGNLNPH